MEQMTWPNILERAAWTAFDSVIGTFAIEAMLDTPLPVLSVAALTTFVSFVKNVGLQRLQILGRIQAK